MVLSSNFVADSALGANFKNSISLAGKSVAGATISATTASIALRGIPSNLAVSGDCTSTIPYFSLMAFRPRLPSDPMPERMTPMLLPLRSSAIERKKTSMGKWRMRDWDRSNKCNIPPFVDMTLFGGII